MAPMYYRGAKAAICVFDVTNEESFNRIVSWLRDLRAHADPNIVICLAGNKCDKQPRFNLSACEELAASLDATFVKTSALTGEGVDEIFETLSKKIADVYKAKVKAETKDADTLKLSASQAKSESTCC